MQHTNLQACGILVVSVHLHMCAGLVIDWFASTDDKVATASFTSLLTEVATRALKRPVSVHVEFAMKQLLIDFENGRYPVWTAVVRTATGGDAVLLKQTLDADALKRGLEASVPLRDGALASDPACLTI